MRILITGIGCIGKSSLRERLSLDFPDNVITVDMDYSNEIPSDTDIVVIVESVHGLEQDPQMFDKILYLLPPWYHPILWLRRGWAWFSTGIVDLSAPKGIRKRFSLSNIPLIKKILIRNIYMRKRWVRVDIHQINEKLIGKTRIVSSSNEAYITIKSWIVNAINSNYFVKTMEVI